MSLFSERLKETRQNKKISQKHIANAIEISETQYQNYEYGKKEPTISNFEKIANYFDVSTDYLLGRTDNPNSHKSHNEIN